MRAKKYQSFNEFWPDYILLHANPVNKILHIIGTLIAIALIFYLFSTEGSDGWFTLSPLVVGYLFSWVGHFVFERNTPTTFKNPFYSVRADLLMTYRAITFQSMGVKKVISKT